MDKLKNISLKNKKVLVRVDFNVPLDDNFSITDDSRIVRALPTIKKIISDGGKAIVISHLGRPKGVAQDCFSLKHIVNHLSFLLNQPIVFCDSCVGIKAKRAIKLMKSGEVIVLENLRFHKEEELGDLAFSNQLSELADVYINDAFGVSHRNHSSVSGIANFFKEKYYGFLLNTELRSLNKCFNSPSRPLTAIIGGAKISGKIEVIESLLNKVDCLIIGGGMSYTFAKALGGDVGISLLEPEKVDLAKSLVEKAQKKGVNLLLPIDSLNSYEFSDNKNPQVSDISLIDPKQMGLDIGPKTIRVFTDAILESGTIIWNGPMGVFEFENFSVGTKKIAESVVRASKKGAFSLVGGGDTVAAIKKYNLSSGVSYISTGGGAMLEFLEGKELPGVASLKK
tara:strand:+ start:14179 stop:15366 length:1188 start_codon:yes stop_codon:yes gene_type:complete